MRQGSWQADSQTDRHIVCSRRKLVKRHKECEGVKGSRQRCVEAKRYKAEPAHCVPAALLSGRTASCRVTKS